MTVFPASGAAGKSGKALTDTVTTTMLPATAAGRPRPQFRDRVRERFGTARVAEHDLVPGLDGEPRDGTADLSASDESHRCHILSLPPEEPYPTLVMCRIRCDPGSLP